MFDPNARWDRSLPSGQEDNNESIEVIAKFSHGKILPLYFVLSGNKFKITKINFSWVEHKGKFPVYYFSVADNSDTYSICLNIENMSWKYVSE